jgi:hypothetical protein
MSASAAASTRAAFGGAFILIAQSAVLADWTGVSTWTTPICWWGYLLLVDALIEARAGRSPFVGRPARFASWVSLSVLFWLVFEAYNLRLRNWEYVGLPDDAVVRWTGYLLSFATILPGLFLTAAALETFGLFDRARSRPLVPSPKALSRCVVAGAACLVVPLLVPAWLGRYLFAPVWVGFILLLEPANYRLGAPSILADLAAGRPGRALRLLVSGYLCGVLWEFWNYWAAAKWIYHVPFLPGVRLFEMPVLGFLGFGPFALEYYAMYNAVRVLLGRVTGRGRSAATAIDLLIP